MHGLTDLNPGYKPSVRTDVGKFSFSLRMMDLWNDLPNAVLAGTVNKFNNKIDNIIKFG